MNSEHLLLLLMNRYLVCKELSGVNMNLISSREISDKDLPELVLKKAKEFDIKFTYLQGLSDTEKFKIISETKLFVFPTYFEGLGYPPLECLYVNTPVITYDLPVLRETMAGLIDEGVFMVPVGDKEELKKKAIEIYNNSIEINTRERIEKNTKFEMRVEDLKEKLKVWQEHFKIKNS